MRTLPTAMLLALAFAAPAHATGFEPMVCSSAPNPAMCEAEQKTLMADWKQANRGNYPAQRNVAFCLKNTCEGAIMPNVIGGCTWRMIIQAADNDKTESDTWSYQADCGSLQNSDRAAALRDAERIFKKIYKREMPIERLLRQ